MSTQKRVSLCVLSILHISLSFVEIGKLQYNIKTENLFPLSLSVTFPWRAITRTARRISLLSPSRISLYYTKMKKILAGWALISTLAPIAMVPSDYDRRTHLPRAPFFLYFSFLCFLLFIELLCSWFMHDIFTARYEPRYPSHSICRPNQVVPFRPWARRRLVLLLRSRALCSSCSKCI